MNNMIGFSVSERRYQLMFKEDLPHRYIDIEKQREREILIVCRMCRKLEMKYKMRTQAHITKREIVICATNNRICEINDSRSNIFFYFIDYNLMRVKRGKKSSNQTIK